ncbi:sterol desaturase family protein [Lutimonas zeaxanthinifaciens]|uniref:sterol desaturase family protein n=1 Tax=Lutimonas zeaxanthinifaciens TaxID=3060215 RepID=UPI00265CAF57|nr:sterol desaturase family protein [Lutimonas sp. YSD2104]WKK64711.1 sterol desaturase family protein [Lutimonas sp. YSD2104]
MEPKVTTEHHRGSATIFKNPFLESLTKTSLRQNIIVYGLVVLLLIYNGIFIQNIPVLTFTGLFVFALFFWTFAEYMLHRYLFHWISENKFVQRFHFIMHGSHHLYPRDTERLLMPPVPGLIMASILFVIFYAIFSILGQSVYTWGFFPGFFLGYLLYSFLHRATHVVKPPKRFKFLWKHHSLHHYKYPDKAFGVSNTLWDHVFGTMPPKKYYK